MKVLGRKNLRVSSGAGLRFWESWSSLRQEVLDGTTDPPWDLGVDICIYLLVLLVDPSPHFILYFVTWDELTD